MRRTVTVLYAIEERIVKTIKKKKKTKTEK